MICGKSPERRVVMPARAFKFVKNDFRKKKKHQKSRCYRREVPEKVKKKYARAASEAASIVKIIKICRFGAQQRCPLVECDRKSKRFRRDAPQKVKKTSRESVGREREHRKLQLILTIWNSSPDSPDSPDVVAWTATRDPPSTRAGGKDDVSS